MNDDDSIFISCVVSCDVKEDLSGDLTSMGHTDKYLEHNGSIKHWYNQKETYFEGLSWVVQGAI